MCSCQGCNPVFTKKPHCRQCVQVFESPLGDSRFTEYHKLVSNLEWDCKYCKEAARAVAASEKAPPNLEDILSDINKLKLKLGTLLSDMNDVKTDLVDLKATAATTYSYMMDVNGKVKKLEQRIVKLDKTSSNFQDLQQTIIKFEHDIGDKRTTVENNNNKLRYNANELQYYDILPDIPNKEEFGRDQSSFMSKIQSRLKNAPKRLWSTLLTDSKKTTGHRCEV